MGLFSALFSHKTPIRTSSVVSCPYSSPYVILDTETTGLNPKADKIIQLSAIKYDVTGKPIGFYNTYLNPGCPIPPRATEINGITNRMVTNAPSVEQVREKFFSFLGNALIVGYNVTFDLRFLQSAFGDVVVGHQYVDVLTIARQLLCMPEYKLETVASHLGFNPNNRSFHDSFTDCEAVAAILHHIGENLDFWSREFGNPAPNTQSHIIRDKLYEQGFQYWSRGEEARVQGDIKNALHLFSMAQAVGFSYPNIYMSYAMAYRKLKDYESEILVLEEALSKFSGPVKDDFEYRKSRAEALLNSQRNKDAERQRKAEKAAMRQKKKELKQSQAKVPVGRPVVQYTDDGTIMNEFISVAAAATAIGIAPKCIRDAANGKQKHAGGFCWRFKSETNGGETFEANIK